MNAISDRSRVALWLSVCALWLLTFSRLVALDTLPLHNDEGLHLTRALQVWRGHPFWEISDGKIVNHWLISFFYPQNAPVFSGRVATVLIALIGLAGGIAIGRQFSGMAGIVAVSLLWINAPYLFFYERTALSDSQAAAWAVIAIWIALRLARAPSTINAVLCGATLALAALFKLTAAPFALTVALIVLSSGTSLLQRLRSLIIVALTVIALFSPVLLYLALRSGNFGVALGWLASGTQQADLADNLRRLGDALLGFGDVTGATLWLIAFLSGILALLYFRQRVELIAAASLPLGLMLLISLTPMPRHFLTVLPPLIALSGSGLGTLWLRTRRLAPVWATMSGLVVLNSAAFALTAYNAPSQLKLPALDRAQFITEHSSGFGLREAMQRLPELVSESVPIIGSMFPDSCRRANFYATGRTLRCVDGGGAALLEQLLETQPEVCLLAEPPPIGIPMSRYAERARLIQQFARPQGGTAVSLWCVKRS
ncbi:MAG: glycosyltransferase family 39 protein [Anaerolineae bacterium]|nr:glycosyltransferase family 39 protein [Anaerolineae bacterium]